MAFEWTCQGVRYQLTDDGQTQEWYPPTDDGKPGVWHPALQGVSLFGLREAVAQLDTYRKALEPFAALAPGLFYPEADVIWIECGVPIPSEHWTALREACKLLGSEIPGEGG